MKDSSNGSAKLIALIAILAILGAAAYFMLAGKSDDMAESTPVATEQSTPADAAANQAVTTTPTETAPTDAQQAVVVETKTLDLPAAAEPNIPSSEKSTDPAVEAMMAPRKIGSDSAPIKVVEYSSLTCGHCSSFHKNDFPTIKANYIDTGKVQFIFKEFPLNKPALDASKILRCMPEDKFVAFQGLLFDEQEKWAYQTDYLTPLKQNAKLAGLSEETIESCLANKDLENRIVGDMKAGTEKFKIQSTPTFIINNGERTIVGHQQMSVFDETFKAILGQAGTSAPVTTPSAPAAEPTAAPTEAPAVAPTTEPAPAAASPTADASSVTTPNDEAAEATTDQPRE